MLNIWFIASVVGIVIIVILSTYAIKLLRQLKQQEDKKLATELAKNKALKQHDLKALKSVELIAKAMQQEQCEISEGCWRVCVLLESLKLTSNHDEQFPAIFALYNGIKHMPILAERKKLAKRERMKLDLTRLKLEAKLTDDVNNNVLLLCQYSNERIIALSED